MEYNPFKKELSELTEKDLLILIDNEISEGWYVEYKADIPKASLNRLDNIKISKSISSFANTKGGWIFWGITCDNKNKPVVIEGINFSEYRNLDDQISQIINSNISPNPIYNLKKVELSNKNIVIVIKVEESPIPPYITSQGIIYQRENNESKPVKDRYILEKLNEKTDLYYESIENFSRFNLPETKGQADWNQTYLELYIFPLPFDGFSFERFFSSEFFKEVAIRFYQNIDINFQGKSSNSIIPLNLGFNSIYSSERSLIIRPLTDKNLIYKSTTVELFENGNLKFLIPLNEFNCKDIPSHYADSNVVRYLLDRYSPYETVEQYQHGIPGMSSKLKLPPITRRVTSDFVNHIKFVDGIELILAILVIASKYKAILEDNKFDFKTEIGFRAKISDCWRKFIFFDNDDYLEKLKLYNIPISPKNQIEIPEFKKGNSYRINLSDNEAYFQIARFILEGIGLPDSQTINFNEIIDKGLNRKLV